MDSRCTFTIITANHLLQKCLRRMKATQRTYTKLSQKVDPVFKKPLPDYLIDFVKKQAIVQDLNLLADDCAFNIDAVLEADEEIAVTEKSNSETILRNAGFL